MRLSYSPQNLKSFEEVAPIVPPQHGRIFSISLSPCKELHGLVPTSLTA